MRYRREYHLGPGSRHAIVNDRRGAQPSHRGNHRIRRLLAGLNRRGPPQTVEDGLRAPVLKAVNKEIDDVSLDVQEL
jgi:hypothetical protein